MFLRALPESEPDPNPFLTQTHRSEYHLTDLPDRLGDVEPG
jgi:hypothetical protein